jgi:hypothetical protein
MKRRRSRPGVSRVDLVPSSGQGATSLGLGAAARTSAASVTFARWINAPRLMGGAGVLLNHRQAWINRDNRRAPPPGVTPAMCCDDCYQRRRGKSCHKTIAACMVSRRRAGWWHSRHGPRPGSGCHAEPCVPSAPHVRVSPGVCLPPASATGADVTADAACPGAPVIVDRYLAHNVLTTS